MIVLNNNFWNNKYLTSNIGWDVGENNPIKEYIDQINNKRLKILIPGCGNHMKLSICSKIIFQPLF